MTHMGRHPSGLLIPGASQGLQILVPGKYADAPIAVCRVPTGRGEVCGQQFWPGEESAFEHHVGRCAREHIGEIARESPTSRVPIMHDPNEWDPEAEAYLREVGQRMLAEGRLELRRNERIGS